MRTLASCILLACTIAIQAQTFNSYTTLEGLPSDNIRDVAVDANGVIWLATQNGVSSFDGAVFTVYSTTSHPGLADNSIKAIAVMDNGDVWVGTDFGVSVFDGSSFTTYTTVNGLSDDQINNIKQAPSGDVWIGTINGATHYDGAVFTAYGTPNIPFGGADHIAFASNGDVYLSGGLGGVIVFDGTNFNAITTLNGLISNKIRSIAITGADQKWVGSAEGISVLNNMDQHVLDHTTMFMLPPPDTLNPVEDVVVDSQGNVWAAVYVDYLVTEGGVCAFDGNSWVQFETADGLAGANVRRLAVDADDDIWVATSTGLTEISDISIGINENLATTVFGLYPNPAHATITVEWVNAVQRSETLEIYNSRLQLVRIVELYSATTNMDISDLGNGVYFAKTGVGVSKFIVNK